MMQTERRQATLNIIYFQWIRKHKIKLDTFYKGEQSIMYINSRIQKKDALFSSLEGDMSDMSEDKGIRE